MQDLLESQSLNNFTSACSRLKGKFIIYGHHKGEELVERDAFPM